MRSPHSSSGSRPLTWFRAEELAQVWTDTREEIAAAISYGENSPDPDPADLLDNVYTV